MAGEKIGSRPAFRLQSPGCQVTSWMPSEPCSGQSQSSLWLCRAAEPPSCLVQPQGSPEHPTQCPGSAPGWQAGLTSTGAQPCALPSVLRCKESPVPSLQDESLSTLLPAPAGAPGRGLEHPRQPGGNPQLPSGHTVNSRETGHLSEERKYSKTETKADERRSQVKCSGDPRPLGPKAPRELAQGLPEDRGASRGQVDSGLLIFLGLGLTMNAL